MAATCQQAEGAAGGDRAELVVVADEQDLGADLVCLRGQGGELDRSGHGRLVDDDELAGVPAPLVLLVLELGRGD